MISETQDSKSTFETSESSEPILVNLKNIGLTSDFFCELDIKDESGYSIIKRDLPKNLDSEYPFETGSFFVYELRSSDLTLLESGKFKCLLRIHNSGIGFSTVVLLQDITVI